MSALTLCTLDGDLYRLLVAFAEWDFIFLCDAGGIPRRRMLIDAARPPTNHTSRMVAAPLAGGTDAPPV